MTVTLKQVRAVLAVAQAANFTRAAHLIHVSQSALSVLIREIESDLGVRLFDRTTHSVELTEAGQEFLPYAARVLADLDEGIISTRKFLTRQSRIAVGAPPMEAADTLPRIIAEFQARHPDATVLLRDMRMHEIGPSITKGELDCGFGPFDRADERLQLKLVSRDPLVAATVRGHALLAKKTLTWRDLADFPVITVMRDNALGRQLHERLHTLGKLSTPPREVSSIATAVGMVDAGLGVAVLPSSVLRIARRYNVEVRVITGPVVLRDVHIATRSGRRVPPLTQKFMAHLAHCIRNDSDRLRPDFVAAGRQTGK